MMQSTSKAKAESNQVNNVVVLGWPGTGKSSLCNWFATKTFMAKPMMSKEDEISPIVNIDGKKVSSFYPLITTTTDLPVS